MIKDKTSDGGGWMNGAMMAKFEETVVIAQTSVTGVQIDNLDIEFVQGPATGNSTAPEQVLIYTTWCGRLIRPNTNGKTLFRTLYVC